MSLVLPMTAGAVPAELAQAAVDLDAADLDTRRDAAAQLAEAGEEGVALLLARMAQAPVEAHAQLVVALGAAEPTATVLQALTTHLADPDDRLRAAAAEAAADLEGDARPLLPRLRIALVDPAPDVRLFAALALGYLVEPDNVPALVPLLEDPTAEVRAAAAEALTAHGRFAVAAAEPLRIRLLQDEAQEVRTQAAQALGRIGLPSPPVLIALAAASQEREAGVRRAAREALGLIGPGAASQVSALITGLSDTEDEEAQAAAAWALGRMGTAGKPAVDTLLPLALGSQALVADAAILALARIQDRGSIGVLCDAPTTRRAMFEALATTPMTADSLPPAALAALSDWVPDNRVAAMRLVAPLAHPEALSVFLNRLNDTEARERVLAAEALVPYGPQAASAVPALVRLLEDPAPGVAEAAAAALLAIGPSAVSAVQAAYQGRSKLGRAWIALVLGVLGGARATDALREARYSPDDALRVAAAAALYRLNPKDSEALDSLTGALTGPSGEARRQAALAVGRLGTEGVATLEALVGALDAPEAVARLEVVRALAAFTAPVARRALRRALGDRDERVRIAAAEALARRREDAVAAVPALAAMLSDDDATAGTVAAQVLAGLGPAAREAIPALIRVEDGDRDRLVAAQDALRRIAGAPVAPEPPPPNEPAMRAAPKLAP